MGIRDAFRRANQTVDDVREQLAAEAADELAPRRAAKAEKDQPANDPKDAS